MGRAQEQVQNEDDDRKKENPVKMGIGKGGFPERRLFLFHRVGGLKGGWLNDGE